ncbi:hypothetical protein EVJ58_g7901 [Rhodofomes roseus]|uniref:Uncharacterized protein n=1 Tax=Rhodofomes roseus TaxID=34475 RepID=A0A4Y9Y0X9_9APHY|nr:hypothetical protein EVJ58_g7901 [Rhodofomes roseus]
MQPTRLVKPRKQCGGRTLDLPNACESAADGRSATDIGVQWHLRLGRQRPMFARPLRQPCPPPALRHVRTYVVRLEPTVEYPNQPGPRKYNARKTYLYNKYTHLIESSPQKPVLLFMHSGFTVPRLINLRLDIAKAAARHASTPSLAGPSPAPAPEPPTLTFIRSSIFGVVLRDLTSLDKTTVVDFASEIEGGLAALSFPNLNPPQLNAILKMLEKTLRPPRQKTEAELAHERKLAERHSYPADDRNAYETHPPRSSRWPARSSRAGSSRRQAY